MAKSNKIGKCIPCLGAGKIKLKNNKTMKCTDCQGTGLTIVEHSPEKDKMIASLKIRLAKFMIASNKNINK